MLFAGVAPYICNLASGTGHLQRDSVRYTTVVVSMVWYPSELPERLEREPAKDGPERVRLTPLSSTTGLTRARSNYQYPSSYNMVTIERKKERKKEKGGSPNFLTMASSNTLAIKGSLL